MAVMPNENIADTLVHSVIAWVSGLLNGIIRGCSDQLPRRC
jgi:hypothetical protein